MCLINKIKGKTWIQDWNLWKFYLFEHTETFNAQAQPCARTNETTICCHRQANWDEETHQRTNLISTFSCAGEETSNVGSYQNFTDSSSLTITQSAFFSSAERWRWQMRTTIATVKQKRKKRLEWCWKKWDNNNSFRQEVKIEIVGKLV
jgi:hypothetical protein